MTITTEGGVTLYLWLLDNAGNVNRNNNATVALNYDATRPSGLRGEFAGYDLVAQ